MKKTLFVLVGIIFCISISFAQNLKIYYNGNLQTNNGIITVNGYTNQINVLRLDVKNTSGSSINVKAKKIENSLVSGSENYFCYAGNCYTPNVYVSLNSTTIPANIVDTSFSADYNSFAIAGTSTITYVFFNTANTADSVCLKVNFTTTVGVNDISKMESANVEAYPNPASNFVNFVYAIPLHNENAKIKISTILGATIAEIAVNDANGKKVVNISDIKDGIYFYSLLVNDKIYYTKKLIIKH